eukprot:360474-Chlamydomonas_euryale.AAC.2
MPVRRERRGECCRRKRCGGAWQRPRGGGGRTARDNKVCARVVEALGGVHVAGVEQRRRGPGSAVYRTI